MTKCATRLLIAACTLLPSLGPIAVAAQDATSEARTDAVRTIATAAAANDRAALTESYLPLAWGLEMMAAGGQTVTEAQKTELQQQYEKERDALVDACLAKLNGKTITAVEDRGTSRLSENELKEIAMLEETGLSSATGDVMVTDGVQTVHFRVFQYQDAWYFVDCR